MNRSLALLLVLLAGCQGGGKEGAETDRLPVQQVELVLQLRDPVPGLESWLESFERVQGADVIVRVGEGDGRAAALVEMGPSELAAAVAADGVRKPSGSVEFASELDDSAWSLEEGPLGWPWRMRPYALLFREDAPIPEDWPTLLRQLGERGPWGLDTDEPELSIAALSALARAAGGNMGSVSVRNLRDEAWAEALAFLTRAVEQEDRGAGAELEGRFAKGELSALVASPERVQRMHARWPQLGTKLAAFPAYETGSGRASTYVDLRVLALPANGPYPALAEQLARALASAPAELVAGEGAAFMSAAGDAERPAEWVPLEGTFFALPVFTRRPEWESALGHAVEQSLERKRNPTQAILDARESLSASAQP